MDTCYKQTKNIVENYSQTIFIEEASMTCIYYTIGLEEEAKNAAVLLGYNYNSSMWYQQSYKILIEIIKYQK